MLGNHVGFAPPGRSEVAPVEAGRLARRLLVLRAGLRVLASEGALDCRPDHLGAQSGDARRQFAEALAPADVETFLTQDRSTIGLVGDSNDRDTGLAVAQPESRTNGMQPRCLGSREKWTLSQPRLGTSSSEVGKRRP